MNRKKLIMLSTAGSILLALSSCAIGPCRSANRPLQQLAPPPEAYLQCMREIKDYGEKKLAQISALCWTLSQRAATP